MFAISIICFISNSGLYVSSCNGHKKVKQSHYMPEQAQRFPRRLRFPDFKTFATRRW